MKERRWAHDSYGALYDKKYDQHTGVWLFKGRTNSDKAVTCLVCDCSIPKLVTHKTIEVFVSERPGAKSIIAEKGPVCYMTKQCLARHEEMTDLQKAEWKNQTQWKAKVSS